MQNRKAKSKTDSYNLGCQLQKEGRLEEAISAYKECPVSFDSLKEIAKCYTKLNQFEMALSYLKKSEYKCKTITQKIGLHNHLAKNYDFLYRKTKDKKYLLAFKETLDKQPNKTDGYYKFYLASYYYSIDQIESSESIVNDLIKEKADDKDLMRVVSLLHIKIKKGQNHNKLTRAEAEKQLQAYSKLPGVYAAELLQIAYDYPELIDLNKISLLPSTGIEDFLKEAGLYSTLNVMPEKEEKIYQDILIRSPQEWQARIMYAYFLTDHSYYDKAIEILKPLINATEGPSVNDRIKAHRQLAFTYYEKCDPVNAKKAALQGLAINPVDAPLLSMISKLEDSRHGPRLKNHFEEARRADENRFNKNHPLPTSEPSKVNYEKNKDQNKITVSSTAQLTQNLNLLKSAPTQIKSNKSTKKKKASKEKIELAPISYDNLIEAYTDLQDENTRIPKVEKKKPHQSDNNKAPASLEIPATLASDSTTQTVMDIVTASESTMTPEKNLPENVPALATPVFNQQQPTYSNCNRFMFFVATAATVATIAATVALSLNS
jgi:hypothetical protein